MVFKKILFLATVASFSILISCGDNSDTKVDEANSDSTKTEATANTEGTPVASAELFSTADTATNVGSAKFYQLADGKIKMDLEINIKERADSNVAVHFHEHGDCGNKGDNTHGHWNPTNENHGQWGTPPFHTGDIGNIKLDAYGLGHVSITTDKWSIKDGDVNNIIGRGIIVHGGTDDYKTQPTGNSGPRIGCGVIVKP